MVSRYGGRKEPTMHCFMSHCAHPPPQHPPPPLSQFRIISAANAARPDVSFHVSGAGFPQQQGGGAGPPSGPQLRGIPHPHHSGNPAIPPPHQQQAPPQGTTQHTGGPTGPAPTSTPPGPADMGKQGPPHMQGQPQMQQGGQMQLNYQSRPAGSQPFFAGGPRGPTPRMPNHNRPVVNMQANNVGQQMFSQHMQMPQMPLYSQPVVPTPVQPVYMPGHVFGTQPRQNHGTSAYYQPSPPQQLLVTPQIYSSFHNPAAQPGTQYYYSQSPVSLSRAGGGVTGAPGPGGIPGPASQQVMAGGPPTQLGQPGGPVGLGLVPGTVSVTGLTPADASTGQTTGMGKQTRRKHALDIVDPKTMKNVDIYEGSGTSSTTPPRSGESSARETPQPNTGPGAMDVAAEFAARVAKAAASEKSPSPPPPSIPPQGAPTYIDTSAHDGPDASGTNIVIASEEISTNSVVTQSDAPPISKQQIIVVEDANLVASSGSGVMGALPSWKQSTQLSQPASTAISVKQPSNSSSKSELISSGQSADEEKEALVKTDGDLMPLETGGAPQEKIAPFTVSAVKDSETTPVVSAKVNAPTVELVHSSREQFPALKSNASHQSPRRKPQTQTQLQSHPASQTVAATVNPPASSPHASRESTPLIESRGPKKVTQVEEPVSTVPVAAPTPKEKREAEKQTRGREKSSSVSSQGSRGEREKSASSQSLGRDQDKSSQLKNKDTSNSKEREKPTLQGREKPSASPAAATLPPASPVVTVQPDIQPPTKAAPVTEEPKQQANGETAVVDNSIDGKANQRSKQQRSKHQKMRDNRKGTEKGSDMDAFVETPTEEAAPAPTPNAPPAPNSSAVALTPVPPTTTTTMTNKEVDNQVAKEEEIDIDKEEKLVAARNEENTKVSAAALKEQENPTPVIESIPNPKPTITLRHTYPEDQWSPINPEGKRKYERDFLMELQNDPQSKKKPENFPLPDILRDNSNRQRLVDRSSLGGARMPVHTGFDNFTPGFIKSPQSKGQVPPKRKSQQGTNPKQNKQNVILSLSLREDVKLHETENAWRPGRMQQKTLSDDQAKTDDLYKKVRGVLNKLTPQKFNTLVNQVQSLPIDSSDRLEGVIKLVFEKAVDEPSFSVAYAQMCKVLATIQVPAEKKKKDDPEELVNFRKLLVNRCQAEFERNSEVELNRGAKLKEIEDSTDPEKKKELQITFEEEERKLRMKSVGNIRFIGELFKLGMLTTNIMHRCIRELLLHDTDEESLECLCKLLTTIGKDLEMKQQDLSSYFQKMREISGKRGSVSSRVRFMLQDVIELRQNKWVPRRDDSNPKTMEQIQKEAEKESLDSQIALNSAPPTPRRQDDRTPLNRKNRQGTGEDGWSVASSRRYIDTTKLKPQKEDNKEVRLGTPGQFSSWVTGASVRKDPKQARDSGGGGGGGGGGVVNPYGNNYFTVLQDSSADDSKRPPLSLSSRGPGKSAPSASIEKERSSAPYKAGEGNRQSRSSSSRSSSRDNSALRGSDEPSLRPSATLSQPPSISASTEDISMVPGRPGTKSPSAVSPLSEPEVVSRTHTLLDEFFNNNNLKESELTVAETFAQENLRVFVRESLNSSLERSSSNRQNAGKLLSHLVKCSVISLSQYLSGLSEYLDIADDLEIDVPKFWLYTAEMIVPMLSSEVIPFSKLHDIAPPSQNGKLICEVLHLLNKDQGPGWIREKWDAAGLKWNDFLPENRIDSFIKEKKLEFTVGGALPTSSSDEINWNSVQEKLCQFLSPNQATSPTFDMICDWIGANVGTCVKEPQFIRALTTAVCQSSICAQNKLNENHFAQQQRLLVKYVDNQEHLELQCLYAIQALMNQMQHPQGLLCQIFQSLWDNSTISSESFIAWENSTDPAEQAGKGVASKSLTSFYTVLREGEEDSSCEES